jgi:hypothetical protein
VKADLDVVVDFVVAEVHAAIVDTLLVHDESVQTGSEERIDSLMYANIADRIALS